MAKFEVIEDKNAKPDVDYNSEEKAKTHADIFAKNVRYAIGMLNHRLSEGNLKVGNIDGGEAAKETDWQAVTGTSPLYKAIRDDFMGTKEASLKLTLDDKSQIVIPVTPVNLNEFTKALRTATQAVKDIKDQIGPQNPGNADQIKSQVFGKLKQELGEFVIK